MEDPGDVLELPADGDFDPRVAEGAAVVCVHPAGARPPLVLVRSWWGEALMHRRLARELGADQPVWSIAPPKGRRVEDLPQDADAWVERVLPRVRAVPRSEPLLLGGWSFGGVIALECARRLAAEGRRVALIALIDTRVPKRRAKEKPERGAARESLRQLDRFLRLGSWRERGAFVAERARRRLAPVAAVLRRRATATADPATAAASDTRPAWMIETSRGQVMSLLQRTVWVAYLKYKPRRLELPALQLWTEESREAHDDASLGFGATLRGPLQCACIPGGHFQVFDDPHVQTLGRLLDRALRRALEDAGG